MFPIYPFRKESQWFLYKLQEKYHTVGWLKLKVLLQASDAFVDNMKEKIQAFLE